MEFICGKILLDNTALDECTVTLLLVMIVESIALQQYHRQFGFVICNSRNLLVYSYNINAQSKNLNSSFLLRL